MRQAGQRLLAFLADNPVKRVADAAVDRAILKPLARVTASEAELRAGLPELIARASSDPGMISDAQWAALEGLKGSPGNRDALLQQIAEGVYDNVEGMTPQQAAVATAAQQYASEPALSGDVLYQVYGKLPVHGQYGLTEPGTLMRKFVVPSVGTTALVGGAGVGSVLALDALVKLLNDEESRPVVNEAALV